MRRALITLIALLLPVSAVLLSTGCARKVTTVQKSERIEESEPHMTSPGTEVLE